VFRNTCGLWWQQKSLDRCRTKRLYFGCSVFPPDILKGSVSGARKQREKRAPMSNLIKWTFNLAVVSAHFFHVKDYDDQIPIWILMRAAKTQFAMLKQSSSKWQRSSSWKILSLHLVWIKFCPISINVMILALYEGITYLHYCLNPIFSFFQYPSFALRFSRTFRERWLMISLYLNILSALPNVSWTNSRICKNLVTNYFVIVV
jgi:hypothetical protein